MSKQLNYSAKLLVPRNCELCKCDHMVRTSPLTLYAGFLALCQIFYISKAAVKIAA